MIKEFEGRSRKDAIEKAINDLGLERDQIDVEVIETNTKGFLFKKGLVKIRVHVADRQEEKAAKPIETETERKLIDFIVTIISMMGFPGKVTITSREQKKICMSISSDFSNILIGKRGKNLDALQLLVNIYFIKIINANEEQQHIILDAENYRIRREENIVRYAMKIAEQVRKNKGYKLLEPMNPFERRLIHTALNEMEYVSTKSEGEGIYKQVRIFYQAGNKEKSQ